VRSPKRNRLSYLAFLAEILAAEVDDRAERRRQRRVHEARFPRVKRLADFDLSASPSVNGNAKSNWPHSDDDLTHTSTVGPGPA